MVYARTRTYCMISQAFLLCKLELALRSSSCAYECLCYVICSMTPPCHGRIVFPRYSGWLVRPASLSSSKSSPITARFSSSAHTETIGSIHFGKTIRQPSANQFADLPYMKLLDNHELLGNLIFLPFDVGMTVVIKKHWRLYLIDLLAGNHLLHLTTEFWHRYVS